MSFQLSCCSKIAAAILNARYAATISASSPAIINTAAMAGDGAVLVAEDGSIFQAEAPKGKVVNSVGAGDSMVAGFVTGYLKTGSYKEAFQMGVCTGSASAFSEELATEPEVLALLDKNKGIFK